MGNRTCSVTGCRNPHRARGWCSTHWNRWKTHGDPLAHVPPLEIKDGGNAWLVQAVTTTLEEWPDGCIGWAFGTTFDGYPRAKYAGRQVRISRALAEAFGGPALVKRRTWAHVA